MLPTPPRLHHFLYVSRLAPGEDSAAVACVMETSRRRNHELQITGMLVFDGEHFAQLLEGEADVVQTLARRIARDARHVEFLCLHDGPAVGLVQRLSGRWRAGYAERDMLAPLQALRGEVAVATFLGMVSQFELNA